MTRRVRLAVRRLAMVLGLVGGLWWMWQLGDGPLAAPPLSIDGVRIWLGQHDATTLAFALVRLEALAFGSYLLFIAIAGVLVRTLRMARATRLVDRATLPFVRNLIGGAAALGVLAAPPAPSPPMPNAPTVTTIPNDSPPPAPSRATLHLETDSFVTDEETPIVEADRNTWIVQPGECLWLIAAEHLTDVTGALPDDRTIDDYWRRLIDTNRVRLVNPEDPDLLFADQVLELPAVEVG